MSKCKDIEDIEFFEHKFRINPLVRTREERINMRNQNERSFGTAIAPWSGYADDLVLFLRSQNGLQNATLLLDHTFKDF